MPIQFKEDRQVCYKARDKFWACLDLNNDEAEKCKTLRKEFEKFCSKQWVIHFDRKRRYEKFKAYAESTNWEFPSDDKKRSSTV